MTITELKERFSFLFNEIEAKLNKAEELAKKEAGFSRTEIALQDFKTILDVQKSDQDKKDHDIHERELFTDNENKRLTDWEVRLNRVKEEAKLTVQKKEDLDIREAKIVEREEDFKKTNGVALQETEAKIKELEVIQQTIEAEKVLDRKRKEMLDIRAEKIKIRESQLQINAEVEIS